MLRYLPIYLILPFIISGCEGLKHQEWRMAKTDSQKFKYLIDVSSDDSINQSPGGVNGFIKKRQSYLNHIDANQEGDVFLTRLVSACFPYEADHWGAATCTTNFYESSILRAQERECEKKKADNKARIEATLLQGVPYTQENISKYCGISAGIIQSAYANAVPHLYGVSPKMPESASELGVTKSQYLNFVEKASQDKKALYAIQIDIAVYGAIEVNYEAECIKRPSSYIINYSKVFH